jgi:hypothetical protein
MRFLPLSACPTCRDLPPDGYSDPGFVTPGGQRRFRPNVDFEIRGGQPVNVAQFRDLDVSWWDDCARYTLYRCPLCGTYYRHEYYYDSGGGVGPGFEQQELVRLTPWMVRGILGEQHAEAAIEELDASFGEMAEASRLDLDSANAHARRYASEAFPRDPAAESDGG